MKFSKATAAWLALTGVLFALAVFADATSHVREAAILILATAAGAGVSALSMKGGRRHE